MDLVADMLLNQFALLPKTEIQAVRLQPSFRRLLSRLKSQDSGSVSNADRFFNRFVCYPRYLKKMRRQFDLFHIVDHSYSQLVKDLPLRRAVVTCHDLDAFRCLFDPSSDPRPAWFRAFSRHILAGLQAAMHVVFVSHTVRNEALQLGLVRPERSSVAFNGVHPSCTLTPAAEPDTRVSELLPFSRETPLILHVGSTIPRKRIDVLLRTFRDVRQAIPAKLVRVGGPLTPEQTAVATEMGILADVVQLPFLTREDLAAVYRRCDLLLITSEREGFGLPMAEAMACGCPVVASDLPVLREIGGGLAQFVPINDEIAWKQAVLRLCAERQHAPLAWRERRDASSQHATRFSWQNTARELLRIYRSIL